MLQTAQTKCLPQTPRASELLREHAGGSSGQAVALRRLVALVAILFCASAFASDARLLAAIRQVEGVSDPAKVGPAGELGYTRITPGVWTQHTRQPFARCAQDHQLEEQVAVRHLAWLRRGLVKARIVPTNYLLALAWNAGLSATVRSRAPRSAKDYARRVSNLVEATR